MFAFILALLFHWSAQNDPQSANITITFTDIKSAKGQLMVALNDTEGTMIAGYIVPVTKSGDVVYTIKNVQPGKYTIAVFHDLNKDQELNTTLVGIPKEPYGFSNNARGMFGPPALKDQTFTVAGNTTLRIALK